MVELVTVEACRWGFSQFRAQEADKLAPNRMWASIHKGLPPEPTSSNYRPRGATTIHISPRSWEPSPQTHDSAEDISD